MLPVSSPNSCMFSCSRPRALTTRTPVIFSLYAPVIREFILQEDRTAPLHAAIFALNMLVGTEHGNSYTEGEYRRWMEEAGLGSITRADPEGDVLVATRV